MSHIPDTRASLILQIQDPANLEAWESFVQLYSPVVYRMARNSGLQHADAEDLMQQVMASVARAVPKWKPQEDSRFRHWLSRIARNAIVNALIRDNRYRAVGGSNFDQMQKQQPSRHDSVEMRIELEYQRQVYRRAAEIVRQEVHEQTWLAFLYTVVQGQSSQSVAESLNTTIGNVHAARSRVMRRLQAVVISIDQEDC